MPDKSTINRFAEWNKDTHYELYLQAKSNPPEGHIENNYTAAKLNAVAEYAFARSRPLFDLADRLAEKGGMITLNAEEVHTLAEGFETLAYWVGDGVVFDKPPEPVKPSLLKRLLRRLTPTSAPALLQL